LEVIDVGFNGDLFKPVGVDERKLLRQKLGFSSGLFSLLFVGALEPRKGLTTLFDALEALRPRVPVELFVAGIGDCESDLKQAARQHRLRDHIHWLGVVHHADLPAFYCAADAFILPSYAEGTPTVLLEAMASGTPTVITRVGGVPDIVRHGENGLLFEPGDAATLRRLIEQLAGDRQFGDRLAENALRDVQSHSLHRQAMRIGEIYRGARGISQA
jgi:glycosyltransferase involved in cell wall biosynthesis